MIKFVADEVWAIDAEWVPDPDTGRRVYGLAESVPDETVVRTMWAEGGATEDDPRPYLKTVLCRLVSVAALIRRRRSDGTTEFDLHSVPAPGEGAVEERELLERFLGAVGRTKPQIVGFNVMNADLPILLQRAMACGVSAPEFCERPAKPWEGKDYFARTGDWMVDLKQVYGGWGRASPSLHELATAARIPGKIDTSGENVVDLWGEGDIDAIVEYNQFDVLTTYLVWLRTAHLSGLVATADFEVEEARLEAFLAARVVAGQGYLTRFVKEWDALRAMGR